ncbi:MAG: ribosomal-processing cysteine protease Prp [Syntrophomonas sp.]|nr:ribosomal-processing cysteine protease Prp [Syntrophomonas sp.]
MVEIKVISDGNIIRGFKAQGHAGYGSAGQDIYCAGVSAITGTALIGLQKHLSQPPLYEVREGWLECKLPDLLDEEDFKKAQLILSTMEAGLISLQDNYPQYIKVLTGRF